MSPPLPLRINKPVMSSDNDKWVFCAVVADSAQANKKTFRLICGELWKRKKCLVFWIPLPAMSAHFHIYFNRFKLRYAVISFFVLDVVLEGLLKCGQILCVEYIVTY